MLDGPEKLITKATHMGEFGPHHLPEAKNSVKMPEPPTPRKIN